MFRLVSSKVANPHFPIPSKAATVVLCDVARETSACQERDRPFWIQRMK